MYASVDLRALECPMVKSSSSVRNS